MSSSDFRLLVGLGNPGTKYTGTRHNVGFMAIERLAQKEEVFFRQNNKVHGKLAKINLRNKAIRLLMPNTFMNESGLSIRATLDWFDLKADNLLVIVDDIDLPIGRLRLRKQGGSGGHNGLKSTIQHLGTEDFCRLRIGIGSPSCEKEERKERTISHVLGRFTAKETTLLDEILDSVLVGFELIESLGIDRAGTHLNSYKPKIIKE